MLFRSIWPRNIQNRWKKKLPSRVTCNLETLPTFYERPPLGVVANWKIIYRDMKLPSLTLIDIPLRADKTRTNYHLYFTQHADFESHRWVFSVYHFIILDFVRVGIHFEFRSSSADQVHSNARTFLCCKEEPLRYNILWSLWNNMSLRKKLTNTVFRHIIIIPS